MSATRLVSIGVIAGHIYAAPNWFVSSDEETQIAAAFRTALGLAATTYIDQVTVRAGAPLKFTTPLPVSANRTTLPPETAKQYLFQQLTSLNISSDIEVL